ncbi:MAG: pyridoxamine 5'-phosphate oxidase family protein, partial [Nocardioidaceae bacterium]
MNPPTDHRGLRVLGFEECLERLRTEPVGRLAFVDKGEPVVFPVNHAIDGVDVVFRTSWGSKLEVAESSGVVAYEVDGYDSLSEKGWSVVVKGTAQLVYESVDTDRY